MVLDKPFHMSETIEVTDLDVCGKRVNVYGHKIYGSNLILDNKVSLWSSLFSVCFSYM